MLEYIAQDVYPGGLARNRKFFAEKVEEGGVEENLLRALYDPQTSGGLLVAVPARKSAAFSAALRRRRVWHVRVGEVVRRGAHAVRLAAKN